MRLKWQCPTCYAELGDKSYAKMITCPYCGSLLIVNSKDKKFYRVPKDKGWYYFSKVDAPGYIKFGRYEEIYIYDNKKWFLLKKGNIYELKKDIEEYNGEIIEEGKVSYIWGDLPFIAQPQSIIKTGKYENGIVKITSREILLFLNSTKKFPDISVKFI